MKPKLCLAFVPVVLLAVIWSMNWRIWHPAATAEDLKIESLLAQTDKMEVNGQVAAHERIFQVNIAEFEKQDFRPLTCYFRLSQAASASDEFRLPGLLWFRFFKGQKELVAISNANPSGHLVLEQTTFTSKAKIYTPLHRVTEKRFYDFIRFHPKLIEEIKSIG